MDAPAAPEAARYECRICWYVYEPAQGDPVWQVAANTRFEDLPAHWRCPNCDAPKDQFLRLDGSGNA